MCRSMCGIQKINELEVVQGRLYYYIPKQETADTRQYTMEGSWLNGLSFCCMTSNCEASETELVVITRKESAAVFLHSYSLDFLGV